MAGDAALSRRFSLGWQWNGYCYPIAALNEMRK
jgi:hypothetical protein